jgi:hypothetical protein
MLLSFKELIAMSSELSEDRHKEKKPVRRGTTSPAPTAALARSHRLLSIWTQELAR